MQIDPPRDQWMGVFCFFYCLWWLFVHLSVSVQPTHLFTV